METNSKSPDIQLVNQLVRLPFELNYKNMN